MNSKTDLLESEYNPYGGVIIISQALPDVLDDFIVKLQISLAQWEIEKIKVVWLSLPIDKANYIPHVLDLGFENHHCSRRFFTLTKRLEKDTLVPPFANHTIGVGGIVINHKNEVLTIREKAHLEKYPHNWKFPGGMLDPYEHFSTGVMREVLEETNIQTTFNRFVGFRHHHKGQFATSNIYAVCRLTPITHDISIQESEIGDARWFPIDEYLADDKVGQYNQQMLKKALDDKGLISIRIPSYLRADENYEVFIPE